MTVAILKKRFEKDFLNINNFEDIRRDPKFSTFFYSAGNSP